MPPGKPAAPLTDWPLQAADGGYGFAWWMPADATFVSQSSFQHGIAQYITQFQDWVDTVLAACPDDVKRNNGIRFFHDWRSIRTYEKDARQIFPDRMSRRPKGYARSTTILVDARTSTLLRMAIQAVNVFATVALSSTVQVTEDPGILTPPNVLPPDPKLTFPLLPAGAPMPFFPPKSK